MSDGALVCTHCKRRYPIDGDIPCFASTDPFYDAYADVHCPYHWSPRGLKGMALRYLPFWSWREWRFFRSVLPGCDRLLDIGCGNGRELFVERSRETFGFDGSLHFARGCRERYTATAVGSLPRLPYRSGFFDAVVSSHLMGHLPLDAKDEMVAEMARVLRPGGLSAHLIETDSSHRTVVAAKDRHVTYEEQFIAQDGHIGLEPAPKVLQLFERHGFVVDRLRLVDAIVPSLLNFRKYLDHPEFDGLPMTAPLRRLDRIERGSRVANAAYEVGMGTFHMTLEQWFGRPERAQFIYVALVKP